MLVVGELDTNVDPSCTLQVVKKLNECGKDYELVYVPGAEHGVGMRDEYVMRRWRDFFVRALMGVETPMRNGESLGGGPQQTAVRMAVG